ncbi:replication protein RepB [Companilactobacillus futsaii JCM 17355]|uniref:Replication protein RepB n=2 Tax=Lactobacillales TaxID=186826 RepID=A0ABR5P6Y4_9LACO|nr:replication protein RepB [Companilactobacillus futsaii JCM 17355]
MLNSERGLGTMPKTIRELADELKVSKQTIQYHYQRLPAKNRQKNSHGANLISPTAERIIRGKVTKVLLAKKQQTSDKEPPKTSKENNDLITNLRREVEDLKSQRDKQLATKDQQISSKDRQIDHLTKLIDQQQRLQLTPYLVVIQPTITNSRCHLFAQKNLLPYNSQFYMPTS